MTLIIGTPHWNGICFNTDTRATSVRLGTYQDNAQKLSHIHGGVGMVASGDRTSAIIVRETVRKHLDEYIPLSNSPLQLSTKDVMKHLLLSSLKRTREHPYNKKRPIYDIDSQGLFGVNLANETLSLNQEECSNITRITFEQNRASSVFMKYGPQIMACAQGKVPQISIEGFPQSYLFQYKVKLYDDSSSDIIELVEVPFGTIVAMGSGAKFNYVDVQDRVLSFVLMAGEAKDVELGAFHLGMIHHFAEQSVPLDDRFNFRTFGGAVIAGAISTNEENMSSTNVLTGNVIDKASGNIISGIEEHNSELWITTKDGKRLKLEPFPDHIDASEQLLWE